MNNKISKHIEELNKEQAEAVLYNEGPLAIIAGAGSGKTKTIINKIAYLIEEKKIKPNRIIAVTFTNKATSEMKERLENMIGKKAQIINISTYHSFASRFLRQEIIKIGYKSTFNILDSKDQKNILSSLYKKYKEENEEISSETLPYNSTLLYISKNKTLFKDPDYLIQNAKNEDEKLLSNIYKSYVEHTKNIGSLDFSDLLIKTKEILDNFPGVAQKWSDKYDYVLVDEFQDTSLLQYEIIKKISNHNNITIVGDPDQTIYSWRQADVNLINNFQNYFKNPKIIKLIKNYRSTKEILDKANRLISQNKDRIHKDLIPHSKEEGRVDFHHASSDELEAKWIAQQIIELRKERHQLKDIAILYRVNFLSAPIEKVLIDSNINYVIFGGFKFFQRLEIKDVISYLKILNNFDEFAFKRMINKPTRKIGEVTLKKIEDFINSKNMNLYRGILKHFSELPVSKTVKKEILIFINLINKYKKALETNPMHLVVSSFLNEINYYKIWNITTDKDRIDNVKELIYLMKKWEKENKDKTLTDYINEISLYTDKSEHPFASDYVSLMTVHSAKGLEFENIFLCGFSNGLFPLARSVDEGGESALEEERRLAYVAITRAKKNLFISDSRGFSLDWKNQKKPSIFLGEMGIDVRRFVQEYIAPNKAEDNYTKERDFLEGDQVSHVRFGNGVVVSVQEEILEIVFKEPYGMKTLMKNHKSIERLK